uniref:Uncharacterized protein n=1 Tax=Parascaris univalens TaxID=6257 RepID=A0A915BHL6_PARUN
MNNKNTANISTKLVWIWINYGQLKIQNKKNKIFIGTHLGNISYLIYAFILHSNLTIISMPHPQNFMFQLKKWTAFIHQL